MPRFSMSKRIDASPEVVFNLFTDFRNAAGGRGVCGCFHPTSSADTLHYHSPLTTPRLPDERFVRQVEGSE